MQRIRMSPIEGIAKEDVLTQHRIMAQMFGLVTEASLVGIHSTPASFCNHNCVSPRLCRRSQPIPLHQDRLRVVAMAPLLLGEELEADYPAVGGLEDLARAGLKDEALAGAEGLDVHLCVVPLRQLLQV